MKQASVEKSSKKEREVDEGAGGETRTRTPPPALYAFLSIVDQEPQQVLCFSLYVYTVYILFFFLILVQFNDQTDTD